MTLAGETPLATVALVRTTRLEIRFKPGVFINAMAVAAAIHERHRLVGKGTVTILMVIPGDAEIDLAVLATDHFQANDAVEGLAAMATVAVGHMNEMLTNLYFAYFPQGFPSRVFSKETEAEEWLDQREAELLGRED